MYKSLDGLFHFIQWKTVLKNGSKLVSRQFCYHYLQFEGYGFSYLLSLEKFIFHQKKMMQIVMSENPLLNSDEDEIDITNFIEICALGMMNNLSAIKLIYHVAIKTSVGYEDKTALEKNKLNFWLEEGMVKHQDVLLDNSNDEQNILHQMFLNGGSIAETELLLILQYTPKQGQKIIDGLIQKNIITNINNNDKELLTFNYGIHPNKEIMDLSHL